jgi:hypothetical protein
MVKIKMFKAQSAMEYLMTYGWAILIIAVVLGTLLSLGVFGSSSFIGTSCIAASGYLCRSPILDTNGNLSISFGQAAGRSIYNVGMACAGSATPLGLPNPSSTSGNQAMVYMLANGFPSSIPSNVQVYASNVIIGNTLVLSSGQTVSVSSLNCYGASGLDIGNVPRGTAFSGGIWVNYTQLNQPPSATNPFLTVKVATLTAKVV